MNTRSSFEIRQYEFNPDLLQKFQSNAYVNGLWPLVYILSDKAIKEAYIGETTDALSRMSNHLKNNSKNKLTVVHLITSDKFNKSATLDIESNLIQYLSGDGQYKLLNANIGLANHTYYQKNEIYWDIFKTIWNELKSEGITQKTLEQINNSDLFKYSPYKSLTVEQKDGLVDIMKGLLSKNTRSTIVEGGAGTGKTILAIYLFKLLNTEITDFNLKEFEKDEKGFLKLVAELKNVYPNPSMALVVPMSSFRSTLKKVFKNIKGLNAKMVIGPSEVTDTKYDILVVDESHRLRRRVNLGTYFGVFDKVSEKLKLDKNSCSELDWIIKQGKRQILFYDANQSIKPSDAKKESFDKLKSLPGTIIKTLKSQFRVKGGNGYVAYIDQLLNCMFRKNEITFSSENYEFILFDSLEEMIAAIKKQENKFGLSRLVAGYSWEWVSKNKNTHDIIIDNVKLKWNSVSNDWVNSENSINEVGCIHTTQGYDLNYTGIIFGNEISFDKSKNEIIIKPENYFDKNGKQSIKTSQELKDYIINIYKTMMLRGIKGTYIYVCDENLREYFKKHISIYENESSYKIIPLNKEVPNSVPFYDLTVAAGSFSELQEKPEKQWIKLPDKFPAKKDHFVCKVVGESMNEEIPNGSLCLFKIDQGGSRNGKIVLVEHYDRQDPDFGSIFTVKYYHSEKNENEEGWSHSAITLKPSSTISSYKDLILDKSDVDSFKIVGIFVDVLKQE
ncbi:MAG TPA: DNA/RNA helicase domain-containing protein [Bacteroidia bacterium]|jgi:DUF2075 family protein|nr:DNA/RNA helicase domain-containing protein [Bacteroidia bacterium]